MLEMESAVARLRDAGMRMTPQRRAVLLALEGNRTHPLAEEVATTVSASMPGVSLSTVYKTLHELVDLGLLQRLDLPGGMRFDPEVASHAHLVCSACGSVVDVELPARISASLAEAAAGCGASVESVHVDLRGTCGACLRRC